MEEKNNNQNEDVKIETTKRLKKGTKIGILALFIVAIILVIQVYASTNGYGNIFFMIKSIFSNEEVKGIDNLLSDVYSSIEVAEGLKVQVQRITIENNETTIYLHCKEEKYGTDLIYRVYDKDNHFISESTGKSTKEGNTDIIKIKKEIDPKTTIKLYIYHSEELLSEITIDLANKELLIAKESDIELKNYLNAFLHLYDCNSARRWRWNSELIKECDADPIELLSVASRIRKTGDSRNMVSRK